ncbi:MAG: hypothetical protein DBP02_03910 [gamma proteobacterium symbiont of Ctena orbiculata]|nr:MAG: hypothetical protein DBP02_03910 [gamma proteobacterium symbiont of Ctena orbiculata]PUB89736.1 MAG: hypothetical protein DBP01_09670 [gamma proteobacterium symbiont of Ctena orbiculata]
MPTFKALKLKENILTPGRGGYRYSKNIDNIFYHMMIDNYIDNYSRQKYGRSCTPAIKEGSKSFKF